MNLYELPRSTVGIIDDVKCYENIRRRMLDLGLIKGTKIIPVFKSPSGDPIAYEIRKTLIAIRKEDSEYITLK
jgi:ferrous iron transport protein A